MTTLTKQKPPLALGDIVVLIPYSDKHANKRRRIAQHEPAVPYYSHGDGCFVKLEPVRLHPCGALECRRVGR